MNPNWNVLFECWPSPNLVSPLLVRDSVWSKLGGQPCTFEAGAFDMVMIDLRMMNLRHMVYALGKQHIGSGKKL